MTNFHAQPLSIDQRIVMARASGVVLSDSDTELIHDWASRMDRQLSSCRQSPSLSDPMNKGYAFPMGVGFTRMTPRLERRIDASIASAGLARSAYAKANHAEKTIEGLLAGIGTDFDRSQKAEAHAKSLASFVTLLLSWKKGATLLGFTIERVSCDRDGYPSTYTISGGGVVKGAGDRVNIVKELFGRNVRLFRDLVDKERARLSQLESLTSDSTA